MAGSKATNKGADSSPSSVTAAESDEPTMFKVGNISMTELEPGETHSDIGLDCEAGIPWRNQHLARFQTYFQTREDGRAAVAFALANEIADELKVAITLAAQESSPNPPA